MSKQPNYVFDDELYHHGIQGQRWGFRRFQNEDGSWTPEGRERYGEGGARSKSDVQKYKAKVSYNTQKYKADLKAKAQRDKETREAKAERYRIKQQGKVDRAARREQNKLDRKQARLDNKLAKDQAKAKDTATLKEKLVRTKRYAMSDDELERSINRLKLEAEYNKQYALAAKPNGALARADRFFDGSTGKFVRDLAIATLPKVAETATKSILDSKLKYANKEDRDKVAAETESFRAKADQQRAEAEAKRATAESTRQKTSDEARANDLDSRIKEEENFRSRGLHQQKIRIAEAQERRDQQKFEDDRRISRSNQAIAVIKARNEVSNSRKETESKIKDADQKRLIEKAKQLGYRDENDPWTFVKGEAHRDSEYVSALNSQLNMGKITPSEYAKLYNDRFKKKK